MTDNYHNDGIVIRPVEAHEIRQLSAIVKETFIVAFGHQNKKEDIDMYANQKLTEKQIAEEFNIQNAAFYFVETDGQLAGYLKLNTEKAQTENKLENALEIERIYVLNKYQGQGIGALMIRFSESQAHKLNKEWIWMGVWDQNVDAIRFYKKNGFEVFSSHNFYLGNDKQTDLLLKKKL